jgi:hypothetical protein
MNRSGLPNVKGGWLIHLHDERRGVMFDLVAAIIAMFLRAGFENVLYAARCFFVAAARLSVSSVRFPERRQRYRRDPPLVFHLHASTFATRLFTELDIWYSRFQEMQRYIPKRVWNSS